MAALSLGCRGSLLAIRFYFQQTLMGEGVVSAVPIP
jgi:hypothetical protein